MYKAFFLGLSLLSSAVAVPSFAAEEGKTKNYYVESPSYGTTREPEPTSYVRKASKTGVDALKNYDWLYLGADVRTRYEYRDNDYRQSVNKTDNPFLARERAYVGVKEVLDPLRFAFEFQNANIYNTKFDKENRDVNELEFIQAYAELHFKDALGEERPFSIRGGRLAFELLDRRLFARNEWRNTAGAFQGFHASFGQQKNDWQLELLAVQPMVREKYETDEPAKHQWTYGAIGHWRTYSDIITLEPFYLVLDQDESALDKTTDRTIHSPGLRAYGYFGKSGFDYDVIGTYQTGRSNHQRHRAGGGVAEVGYRFKTDWKPRFSVNYGYGSGDENPLDSNSERFERFYGFSRPWSSDDYIQWENVHAAKTRVEFVPLPKLKIDSGYSAYWLASDKDRWSAINLRDSSGKSGDFMGHEFDIRARYPLAKQIDGNIGYAHFESGEFLENAGRGGKSDFIYVELTFRLFE